MEAPKFDELPQHHVLTPEEPVEDTPYVDQKALAEFVSKETGADHVAYMKPLTHPESMTHLRRRMFSKSRK